MRHVVVCFVAISACLPPDVLAQSGDALRKQATAVRVASGAIRVDGRLDDEAWRLAPPVTDFVQKEPTEGAEPTDPMEVRFAYDDSALYVGARMVSREGRAIQAPKIDSENFETNDFAQLNGADGLMINGSLRYRETRPGRLFRSYSIGLNQSNDLTLRGLRQGGHVRPELSLTWANYWTTSLSVTRSLDQQSVSLTRGGPLMARASGWMSNFSFGNRATSQTRLSGNVQAGATDDGGRTRRVSTTVSFRPGPRWQLSASPFYETLTESQQYVTTFAGGRAETYGSRYVFSFIERSTLSTEFRLGFTLKPDMNLDVYAEPFAASGRYYDYGELLAPRSLDRIAYGTSGTTVELQADGTRVVHIGDLTYTLRNRDFNTLSFRSNVVLRWEWRPGSTLYLVWQQDRLSTERIGSLVNPGDMFRSFTAPGSNIFVVKTSFWVPVR